MSKVTTEMVATAWNAYKDSRATPDMMFRTGLQALFDANLISLPVDRDRVREDVVRECLNALPKFNDPLLCYIGGEGILTQCHNSIARLLPTKDRAEELVEEWADAYGTSPEEKAAGLDAIRWLIAREKMNG